MGRWAALVLAPVLGLASVRGLAALVLGFLGADLLDNAWRGLGRWWLPAGLYLVFFYALLLGAFILSRRGRGGSGTETP